LNLTGTVKEVFDSLKHNPKFLLNTSVSTYNSKFLRNTSVSTYINILVY